MENDLKRYIDDTLGTVDAWMWLPIVPILPEWEHYPIIKAIRRWEKETGETFTGVIS